MGIPETTIRGAVSAGSTSEVIAPEYTAPGTLGPEMAKKLKAANPAQNPSLSSATISGEVEVHGALEKLGFCTSVVCQNVDFGARLGYRFGLGSLPFAAYAQYNQPITEKFSVVGRASIGGEGMWGDVPSARDMKDVHISGTQFQASAGIGAQYVYKKFPFLAMFTVQSNDDADLGHGFNAKGGYTAGITLAGGFTLFGKDKPTQASAAKEACQEAADGFKLGPKTLSAAVDKCKDSALPVFEAMAKRLKEFKLDAADAANHKEYRQYLEKFADGIVAAEKASKLTEPEAIQMMKELAGYYFTLVSNMLNNPTDHKNALGTALEALSNAYIPLLKVDPSDTAISKNADKILEDLLDKAALSVTTPDGEDTETYLLKVLKELVDMGKDSTWVKGHKKDLLDAAKKITTAADRKAIETSIKNTFK